MTSDIADIVQKLATPLAWPAVALIAIIVLRKHLVTLAQGVARLHELIGKGGELATLTDKLGDVKSTLQDTAGQFNSLKREAADIKEMVETLSIKGQSSELERLSEQPQARENDVPVLSIDDMFAEIEQAWQQVKAVIQNKARVAGVSPYLMGTKGVSNTVKEMVDKAAITQRSAELAVALSAQYQRFYRTTSPREEWLTHQVYKSFLDAANETKRALERRVS
jgi:hypothetical protein